jgi:hypothetical protein
MKRAGVVALYAIGGYVSFAVAGYLLVSVLSSNTHDRSVEAAMTSTFVLGPLGALVAMVVGVIRTGRKVAGHDAAG